MYEITDSKILEQVFLAYHNSDWLDTHSSDGSILNVNGDLVAKLYNNRINAPGHYPFLKGEDAAKKEFEIGTRLLKKGFPVPFMYGLIPPSWQGESADKIYLPRWTLVMDRLPGINLDKVDGKTKGDLLARLKDYKKELGSFGFSSLDLNENNIIYDEKTDILYLFDFVKWKME